MTAAAATESSRPPDPSARRHPAATPWPTEDLTGSRGTTSSWTHSVSTFGLYLDLVRSRDGIYAFVFCAAANLAHSLPVTLCYHTAFLVLWSFIFCSPQEMTFSSASQAVTAMTTEPCWSVSLSTLLLLSAWLTCFFAVIADPSCVGWFDYIYFF